MENFFLAAEQIWLPSARQSYMFKYYLNETAELYR